MRRRIFPLATAAAVIAAALTGCSAVDPADTCEALLAPGALSDSVRVSGDTADTLRVTIADGAEALSAQRSIIPSDAGDATSSGDLIQAGSIFEANLAYVNATTGEVLQVSPGFGTDQGQLFLADPEVDTIFAGAVCSSVGDTVVIAYSPEESNAMGVDGQLVVLAEMTGVAAPRATGASRSLPSGFPAVTNDETGRPGLVLPPQQAPSTVKSALRIEGTGESVTDEHSVIGNVLTVGWDGKQIKNSWDEGPQGFGTTTDIEQSGMTFRAALTGYPVGSQVVVIEPGDGAPRVSVIDILAVA